MDAKYFGLIELGVTIVGFAAFYFWDRRSLARDIAAREVRERAAKEEITENNPADQ